MMCIHVHAIFSVLCFWAHRSVRCLCTPLHAWSDPLDRQMKCWRKQPAMTSGRRAGEPHPWPAGRTGEGGGSRWCGEVSGSGGQDEHRLSNSTLVRCQSHTDSKRPFIPQTCAIDLFIPAPSLYFTISASLPYHFSLPFFFFMSNTSPTLHLLLTLVVSCCLVVTGKSTPSLCMYTHQWSPHRLFFC